MQKYLVYLICLTNICWVANDHHIWVCVKICRPALFKKAMRRYNIAWWAYSYPITMLALTSLRYEEEVKGLFPLAIKLLLSGLSVLVLFGLLLFTASNPKLLLPDHDDPIDLATTLPMDSANTTASTIPVTLTTTWPIILHIFFCFFDLDFW